MINTGNDALRIDVTLDDVSLQQTDMGDISVMLGDHQCVLQNKNALMGVLTVTAPQLPKESAGILNLTVTVGSLGTFQTTWEFMKPPSPRVDMMSVKINDAERNPLWLKLRGVNSTYATTKIEFKILNLHAKFGHDFDELQVWFAKTQRVVAKMANRMDATWTIEQNGRDVDFSFELDVRGVPEDHHELSVHVLHSSMFQQLINFTQSVQVKDMSVPLVIDGAVAPPPF